MREILLTIVVIVMWALQPVRVSAADLDAAFKALVGNAQAEAPGYYRTPGRNVFVAGGLEMRTPRTTATLFSVSGARLNAGCQGVSIHFGGFSFIGGEQIEQLVKNITQAAPGFIVHLVLKNLCPQCEAVLQLMQRINQAASQLAIDSCSMSSRLTNSIWDQMGMNRAADRNPYQLNCAGGKAAAGEGADLLDTLSQFCATTVKAIEGLESMVNGPSSGGAAEQRRQSTQLGIGNLTWNVLTEIMSRDADVSSTESVRQRTFLMNLIGSRIVQSGSRSGASLEGVGAPLTDEEAELENGADSGSAPQAGCTAETVGPCAVGKNGTLLPSISAKDSLRLFMCGAPTALPSATEEGNAVFDYNALITTAQYSTRVVKYCAGFWNSGSGANLGGGYREVTADGSGSLRVITCDEPQKCLNPYFVTIGSSDLLSGPGFLLRINRLLRGGVHSILTDTPLNPELLALIRRVPYPLYQAINAAAVYPVAIDDLLDALSTLVAESLAYAYFDDFARITGYQRSLGEHIDSNTVMRIGEAISDVRNQMDAQRQILAQELSLREGIWSQIKSVNQAIQREVMTEELLGNARYAGSISRETPPTAPAAPSE